MFSMLFSFNVCVFLFYILLHSIAVRVYFLFLYLFLFRWCSPFSLLAPWYNLLTLHSMSEERKKQITRNEIHQKTKTKNNKERIAFSCLLQYMFMVLVARYHYIITHLSFFELHLFINRSKMLELNRFIYIDEASWPHGSLVQYLMRIWIYYNFVVVVGLRVHEQLFTHRIEVIHYNHRYKKKRKKTK